MMSNMSSTEKGPPGMRKIDPPQHVWIKLSRLFPAHTHHLYHHTPHGIQTTYEGPGLLLEEVYKVDSSRLGLVRFPLTTADEQWQTVVSTYVPQHLYRPMHRRRGNFDDDRH